jgi:hypothetical protein
MMDLDKAWELFSPTILCRRITMFNLGRDGPYLTLIGVREKIRIGRSINVAFRWSESGDFRGAKGNKPGSYSSVDP